MLNYDLGVCIPGYAGKEGGILFASPAVMRDQVDAVVAAGIGWLRTDVVVQQGCGTPGTYDWSAWEPLFAYAQSKGLRILACLQGQCATDGAAPSQPVTDTARRHVADFAAAFVSHFPVNAVEVGNEMNTARFWAPPSVTQYGALLTAVYRAVKAVRPKLPVITGGTGGAGASPTDVRTPDWYAQLYAGGYHRFCDAITLHPYSGFTTVPGRNEEAHISTVRALMNRNGDTGKPIWGTETGAPTGGSYGVSQATQAKIISNSVAYFAAKAGRRGPLFLYTLDDFAAPGASADAENYFGLRTYAGIRKASFATIQGVI